MVQVREVLSTSVAASAALPLMMVPYYAFHLTALQTGIGVGAVLGLLSGFSIISAAASIASMFSYGSIIPDALSLVAPAYFANALMYSFGASSGIAILGGIAITIATGALSAASGS